MAYEILNHPAPVGGRVHFRRSEPEDEPSEYVSPMKLAQDGIAFAYVDGSKLSEEEALNSLGIQLRTENPPYEPHPPLGMKGWYRFMDDLETLSERAGGLVIIVDNAAPLFANAASWVFELITIWVHQLAGWQRRRLPCHLVFQMEPDPSVQSTYGQGTNGS